MENIQDLAYWRNYINDVNTPQLVVNLPIFKINNPLENLSDINYWRSYLNGG